MYLENRVILDLCQFLNPDKEKIKDAMSRSLHWPYILGQLLFHRMGGVAYYTLKKCELLGRINREVRNSLKTIYDNNEVKAKSLSISLAELAITLKNTNFPFALLKGAYLASLYPSGLRTSNDVDILINQQDISALECILKSAGFIQGNIRNGVFLPATRTEILSSRMNRGETVPFIKKVNLPAMEYLEIDINFSLDFKAKQENDIVSTILKNTQPLIETENGFLPTLEPSDFMIHLCCHLFKEATVYNWVEMERDLSLYKFADIDLLLNEWKTHGFFVELADRVCQYNLNRECYYSLLRTVEIYNLQDFRINNLLKNIIPPNTEYLTQIIQPEKNKIFRYDMPYIEWLFYSGRKEKLYETSHEGT